MLLIWTVHGAGGKLTAVKVILANNGQVESFGYKRWQLMHILLKSCFPAEEELVRLPLLPFDTIGAHAYLR